MGKKIEFTVDGNFKKNSRDSFEAALKRRAKMTPEEREEDTRKLEQSIVDLRKWVDDHDEDGTFARMRERMEDPSDPLYDTYTHDGDDLADFDVELDFNDELTIEEYRQFIHIEGMTEEEALEACGGPIKVTEKAVLWGDETEAEKKYAELIISIFGEEVKDTYTQEEKDAFLRTQAELIAAHKGKGLTEEQKKEQEKVTLISDLIHYIEAETSVSMETEDEFLEVYYTLPEKEKKVLDLCMEDFTFCECSEKMGISQEEVQKYEEKAVEKLLAAVK